MMTAFIALALLALVLMLFLPPSPPHREGE
jgi:hypothetical protein